MLGVNACHNYAYGGATIQRFLSPTGPPTVGEQITAYLSDLANNATSDPGVYQRKALSVSFTTTNDINSVWSFYLDSTHPGYGDLPIALYIIEASARELIANLSRLIPSENETDHATPDFLILPILPVELTPQSRRIAREAGTTTDIVAEITNRYNEVLMEGARNLSTVLGTRGSVYTYDVPAYVQSMQMEATKLSPLCTAGFAPWPMIPQRTA